MKLKTIDLNGATYAEVAEGKPIYLGEDGKEIAFDAVHTVGTITRLNGEAKGHRERAEAAERSLKAFEGLEPDAARKALDTVKNFADGDLVKAGKVEEMKQAWERSSKEEREAAVRGVADDRDRWKGEAEKLKTSLHNEMVGGSFARSKFVSEKVAIPPTFLQAQFNRNFAVEDDRIVARDSSGNPIYSRTRPGELANFDEALEVLIGADPYRDSILKGTGSSGSGAIPGRGGHAGNGKSLTQAQFDALPPMEQAKLMSRPDRPTIV